MYALIYLHSNHCMHRDVKGHNILLTEDARVKLVDFGVSSHLAVTLGRRNTSVGTPYWMAPEVIACEQQLDSSYDSRCDVWSVGITAIELAEGDPPLSDLHPMRALFQIPRNPPPQLSHPEDYTPELLPDFISECLIKDLEQRPFVRELLEHPLMRRGAVCAEKVRLELQAEIQKQRAEGRSHRQPEVTTKHGKLKPDRKSKPQPMYMDDLAALDILSEAHDGIVEQLQRRFDLNQIYTYIGDILVAVNPFTDLGLYTDAEQRRYRGQARSDNPPHIFAVADAAYQALLHQRQNQAIVISGESGAGKTESANLLLKQLVFLGKAPNRNLEERILQVNPIMEAFGNARTGINANSSRFGKFLDLTMTRAGKVTGARVAVYLLEQSRVSQQAHENEEEIAPQGEDVSALNDVVQREKRARITNIERYHQLNAGFNLLGFQEDEVDTVYRILAAILHLGDLEFGEVVSQDNTDNKSRIIDLAPLHRVSRLLGVEPSDMLEALTSNSVVTRGETITRNNTVTEACAARDAMAKGLYGRLGEPLAVGLLDIFGFENFPRNSFEQLCINIANEQIQYYFNQHIFTWEQQEYMAEGIPVDLVEFSDNRPVLDMLLSRPMGLLALLDEESRFPRSTDRSLVEKFHNNVKSKFYVRPKSDALCFAIHHYAGRVVYQAESFMEKNRNFLPPEVIQLLRQSHRDMVRFLFQCPLTKTGNLYSPSQESPRSSPEGSKERYSSRGLASQSRAQQTVATYFRYSLMDLLQKMVSGSPQFVRCIKPNDSRKPKLFDSGKVIRKIVLVQACIRRWLARTKYQKAKWQMAHSVVTLQRYVRGWITRRQYQEQKRLAEQKRLEEEAKAKKDFRGYTVRRRWGPELAARVQRVLETYRNPDIAKRALEMFLLTNRVTMKEPIVHLPLLAQVGLNPHVFQAVKVKSEGLTPEDAVLVIQRYFRNWRHGEKIPSNQQHRKKAPKPASNHQQANKAPDRQADLISFSHNEYLKSTTNYSTRKIHMSNQESHKYLRRNKPGVRLSEIGDAPKDYVRPRGFQVVPSLIGNGGKQSNQAFSYYEALQEEMSRNRMETLDMDAQRREVLSSQARENVLRERHLLSAWHQVAAQSNKQPSNNNNNKNLHPRYGRISSKQDNNSSENFRGFKESNAQPTDHPWGGSRIPRIQTNSNSNNNNNGPFSPASDLRRLLRSTSESPEGTNKVMVADQGESDLNGPYNFRQLLRPTAHPPTESLRKRKGVVVGGVDGGRQNIMNKNAKPPSPVGDSPIKRRAKPVNARKV
ncbi:hypothetical protein C0J52_07874 [Blattella germanica]|nr:hypothetical protein C0J52_07874 [Blattella germanica]